MTDLLDLINEAERDERRREGIEFIVYLLIREENKGANVSEALDLILRECEVSEYILKRRIKQ